MENIENNRTCGFGDDGVSYLYDEMNASDRHQFEDHLRSCTECTDEFAGISNARFSVFEWQKEEFAPLSTPEFRMPYQAEIKTKHGFAGIFDQIRGAFSGASWSTAVAAAVLLAVGITVFSVAFRTGGEEQIASNNKKSEPIVQKADRSETIAVPFDQLKPEVLRAEKSAPNVLKETSEPDEKMEVRKAEARTPVTSVKRITVGTQKPRNESVVSQNSKAPVLSNFEETEDKSLRLADLFDEEIGKKL